MKKKKNRIISTVFSRVYFPLTLNQDQSAIVLYLKNEIPAAGYGAKEIRKMLKDLIIMQGKSISKMVRSQ
jgi:hypothetical protein